MKSKLSIGDKFWYYVHPDHLVDSSECVFEGEVKTIKINTTIDKIDTIESVEYRTYLGLDSHWVDDKEIFETKELAILALNGKLTLQLLDNARRGDVLNSYYDKNSKLLEEIQGLKEIDE